MLEQGLEERVAAALDIVTRHLVGLQRAEGYWEGHLSSSALSTATAISALGGAGRAEDFQNYILPGLRWLARTQNADGGWGDTVDSPSNLSTSILCVCAMKIAEECGMRNAECGMVGKGDEGLACRGGIADEDVRGPSNCGLRIADCGLRGNRTGIGGRGGDGIDYDYEHEHEKWGGEIEEALRRAEEYVCARAGRSASERVAAIRGIYGEDRTFAVPILMNCALAGLVPWADVPPLPFELALFPRGLYKALRLHVVSYALPALIAVGALIHDRNPTRNPAARWLRNGALKPVLAMLEGLQPASGGFLEATPLTSFVGMSLVALVGAEHPVAAKCLAFLRASAQEDGSWPIDTNLEAWVTTGAVAALARTGKLDAIDGERTRAWIAEGQWHEVHPFTGAAPGAFAWTHLSGGVPDADDTAGAILALGELRIADCGLRNGENAECGMRIAELRGEKKIERERGSEREIIGAVKWLLDLQNGDGGWPTFCRGWGKLPFDRSAPDLTAHVLRALMSVARGGDGQGVDEKVMRRAIERGFQYLKATQRDDGAWVPLWFGNQHAAKMENPVLGTARVLLAWAERGDAHEFNHPHPLPLNLHSMIHHSPWASVKSLCNSVLLTLNSKYVTQRTTEQAQRTTENKNGMKRERVREREVIKGVDYLVRAQNPDGGWGGERGVASTVEETALAVGALTCFSEGRGVKEALESGVRYLVGRVEDGTWLETAPIGLYFASLWYSEKLYPVLWTVEALGRMRNVSIAD